MAKSSAFLLMLAYIAGIAVCGIGLITLLASGLVVSTPGWPLGWTFLSIGAVLMLPTVIIGSFRYIKQARYSLIELTAFSIATATALALMRPHYPFGVLSPAFIVAGALAASFLMTGVLSRFPWRLSPRMRLGLICVSALAGGGFGEPVLSSVALISYLISIPLLGIKPATAQQFYTHTQPEFVNATAAPQLEKEH
jgi:hypothetical protein